MKHLATFLRRRPRRLVGVDISGARVKLLELECAGTDCRVLAYASEAIPEGAIRDRQILDVEAVARVILRALERSGSRSRDAAIAVAGTSVITKTILMPAGLSADEMESQIHFDAEHHIPHPIEEVSLDFQILAPDADHPQLNRVLLAACRRDHIEIRAAALEMAHMRVRLVDVEQYALQNACCLLNNQPSHLGDKACIAIFDVGDESTRLTVQRGGESLYAREIDFSGAALTQEVITHHGLGNFDMLRTRLRSGELGPDPLDRQIHDFALRMSEHIERALSFYQSVASNGDAPVDHIVVTGSPTLFPNLERALATSLPWPLSLGNPLQEASASTTALRNHVDTDAPMLMVAAGLALRGST